MITLNTCKILMTLILAGPLISVQAANADGLTEWNLKAREIVVEAGLPTPPSNRALAIAHTSAFEAVNAITKEFEGAMIVDAPSGASVNAAIAAAMRTSLLKTAPAEVERIEKAYADALAAIPNSQAKSEGIAIGEHAAEAIWAARKDDGAKAADVYRPHTTAGNYVPTKTPAVPHWGKRTPWMLSGPAQMRPGPPPALTSETWARDFVEVKILGENNSKYRSEEQTKIAKFWEATLPPIYHGVVHSVAEMPGRSVTENARLFAAVTRASDDALIAVFEAKYHYGFWRPVTAVRNADIDDNAGTIRDASWSPYIPTPMHPEYPCAHCVVSGTVGTILQAELGDNPTPLLTTSSDTAGNAQRQWTSIEDFIQEVSDARIYDGVHYRNSAEIGTEMGRKIGTLAAETYLSQPPVSEE